MLFLNCWIKSRGETQYVGGEKNTIFKFIFSGNFPETQTGQHLRRYTFFYTLKIRPQKQSHSKWEKRCILIHSGRAKNAISLTEYSVEFISVKQKQVPSFATYIEVILPYHFRHNENISSHPFPLPCAAVRPGSHYKYLS